MQTMRDLMRTSLARGLRQLSAEDRLAAALPLVCGSALASRCSIARLTADQVLHVHVDGSEWVQALGGMRERVRADLQRVAGVPLTRIHFHEAALYPGSPSPATAGQRTTSRSAAPSGAAPNEQSNRTRRSA